MLTLFALIAAGCGGEKPPAKKEVLKVGVTNFADNLEPTDHAIGWTLIRYGLGETLARFDKQMKIVPWLAESWEVSDDKLTWTIRINDKAKFSNGNKLTAEAARSSLQRTIDKSIEAKNWAMIDSMKADGQTLTVKTQKPLPGLIGVFCDPQFTIIDTSVKDRDILRMGPICTGPYTVKSFSRQKAVMEANPNYWDGAVPFKSIEIPSLDDPNTRAMALQKGEIDVAVNIASGDMDLFKDTQKFRISEIASIRDVLARLNVKKGRPLADKKVREALIASLDRPTYCKVLLKGTFSPGGPAMSPNLDYGYEELMKQYPARQDLAKAKALLEEAGWKDSDGDGYVDKNGKNLEIEFTIYSSRAELPMFAEATQADAKKAGIKVNVNSVSYNILDQMGKDGNYDMLISNIMTIQAGSPLNFMNMYWRSNKDGNNPQNGSGYSNSRFDELGDMLTLEFDPAKRRQIIIDMQKVLLDDAATIIFGYPRTNIISRADIANADIQPCDYYWITKDWKVAEK